MMYQRVNLGEYMSLRVKYVNSTLVNKICSKCHKTYPRDTEHFYLKKNANKNNEKINTYEPHCITCTNKRTRKYKKKNSEKVRLSNIKYRETESGYFSDVFNTIKRSRFYVASEFPDKKSVIEHWQTQKKIYGMKCPATGVLMTMKKGTGKALGTNISKDRILVWEGYTKVNTIFVTWDYNNAKGAMTPEQAKAFLNITRMRFGTDELTG